MQTLYKLLFAILVLKARKDGFRVRGPESGRASNRDISREAALLSSDAALGHTR